MDYPFLPRFTVLEQFFDLVVGINFVRLDGAQVPVCRALINRCQLLECLSFDGFQGFVLPLPLYLVQRVEVDTEFPSPPVDAGKRSENLAPSDSLWLFGCS